jgi:hypothetical protein
MVETTEAEISTKYAAGLFDGEGYVGLAKDGARLRLRLEVSGCYKPALEKLAERWGGIVYKDKRKDPAWRTEWKWHLGGRGDIAHFLSEVQPYLLEKRSQVGLVLAMLGGNVSREMADAELRRMKRVNWN